MMRVETLELVVNLSGDSGVICVSASSLGIICNISLVDMDLLRSFIHIFKGEFELSF
jgi:hypothetical protein